MKRLGQRTSARVCWWCSFGQDLLRYADRCRKAIAELWSEDGIQLLQPPQEVLKTAAGLGLTPGRW